MSEYIINAYAGVFKLAEELFLEGKYKESFPKLLTVVENFPDRFLASYYLAECYYKGLGTEKNVNKAYQNYMMAASKQHAQSQYMVGYCYEFGIGTIENSTQAVVWYTEAAKQGLNEAQFRLGLCYKNGVGIKMNTLKALNWLTTAAKRKHIEAQKEAAECFETIEDYKGAATLYLAAAQNGDVYAQEKIADFYADGKGITQSSELALKFYEQAAEKGNTIAQLKLGDRYYEGKGITQSLKQAIFWWLKAANAGNADAQNKIAKSYYNGEGLLQDTKVGFSWWLKAANGDNVEAMLAIADFQFSPPSGFDYDYHSAKYWWTKAAEFGDPTAMYKLGMCYEKAIGIPMANLEESFKWYRLASQNGSEEAAVACKRFSKGLFGKIKVKEDHTKVMPIKEEIIEQKQEAKPQEKVETEESKQEIEKEEVKIEEEQKDI